MNVNAITGAVRAQPIKALCVVALASKILHIAYSQLTNAGSTKDGRSCFSKASNWTQEQFIVRNSVKDKHGDEVIGKDGAVKTKIAVIKTAAWSTFSLAALAGAAFLTQCAVSQIKG